MSDEWRPSELMGNVEMPSVSTLITALVKEGVHQPNASQQEKMAVYAEQQRATILSATDSQDLKRRDIQGLMGDFQSGELDQATFRELFQMAVEKYNALMASEQAGVRSKQDAQAENHKAFISTYTDRESLLGVVRDIQLDVSNGLLRVDQQGPLILLIDERLRQLNFAPRE